MTFLPQLNGTDISPNVAVLSLYMPASLHYFAGHFPDRPILPGVVQIDWAIKYANQYFRLNGAFSGMEAVKFHEFIVPSVVVELRLRHDERKSKVYFEYVGEKGRYSSGRIRFGRN